MPPSVTPVHVVSKEHQYHVTVCPHCGSSDIRGPYDTNRSAKFLFTRAWFCRVCQWDREMRMFDDVADAAAKAAKREARNKAARERRLGGGA